MMQIPTYDTRVLAYLENYEGICWIDEYGCFVEVWLDGSFRVLSPAEQAHLLLNSREVRE